MTNTKTIVSDYQWPHQTIAHFYLAIRRPARPARRQSPDPIPYAFTFSVSQVHVNITSRSESGLTKLRVENLHYDLTEDDLDVENLNYILSDMAKTGFRISSTG
jgi:hypothetical protein